ncbi:hypothetical protein CfE428DRAFT_4381 [Chthoniobacter flavus Ellin428]|uniref:DUF7796 domain-containing protein n=1 Tax=Chthoniobacter flavus Ellin428 TaxID=497964 RepID=B4D642_9BACT|nr:hypothetical protein [Chthoniobacter flavus]EDY18245.1 hypothetical protein CfE428DRAFT_4381 [Chthoniobacter flavus Ellin428]TCO91407.1 hypothetical protein EV701_108135 [Chthoniobacter flavus]
MRVAILVSGQCRTLDVCLPSIQRQVLAHFPSADLWISVADGSDSAQASLLANTGLRVCLLEKVNQPTLDERDYRAKSVGGNFYIGEGLHDRTIVQRILRQAWHLRRVYEWSATSGNDYDVYIRLRPDQWFFVGVQGLPDISPTTAVVPWWGSFDGVNDRFAVLGKHAAEAYCWWPCLDRWLAEGCRFHPETLTKYALMRAGCKIVHTPASAATLKRDESGKVSVRPPEVLPTEVMELQLPK